MLIFRKEGEENEGIQTNGCYQSRTSFLNPLSGELGPSTGEKRFYHRHQDDGDTGHMVSEKHHPPI